MIKIRNLTFSFNSHEEKRTILNNINLDFHPGESVVIMGPNGSGKSTLARCLNGLHMPDSGTVSVDGMLTTDEKQLLDIRRQVGMVFQNPDNQIVSATVEREIAFGLENLGIPYEEMREIVVAKLHEFDLYPYRTQSPHYLSGGEKQRLALAAVLAMEPEYLVLDEPTSLLDPYNRKSILDIIQYLNKREDNPLATILITQFPDEALTADRLVIVHKGEIFMDDKPDTIFKQVDTLLEIGLEPPVQYVLERLNSY